MPQQHGSMAALVLQYQSALTTNKAVLAVSWSILAEPTEVGDLHTVFFHNCVRDVVLFQQI